MRVKLKDRGTIFHDISQDFTLSGGKTVGECQPTPKVNQAIKAGVLEELKTDEDYEKALEERGEKENPVVVAAESKPAAPQAKPAKPLNQMNKTELTTLATELGVPDLEQYDTNAKLAKAIEDFQKAKEAEAANAGGGE